MLEILESLKSKVVNHTHHWTVRRTIWPFPEGWGTVCDGCQTILDTGLPEWQAKECATQLNAEAHEHPVPRKRIRRNPLISKSKK